MSNTSKQLKKAQTTRNRAVAERNAAVKERDAACEERDQIKAEWSAFTAMFGATPEEGEHKLKQAWANIQEQQEALAEKERQITGKTKGLEQYDQRLQQESNRLLQVKAQVEQEQALCIGVKNDLDKREQELKEIAGSIDVKRLQRRLRNKSEEANRTAQKHSDRVGKLREERDNLKQEVNRLTPEYGRLLAHASNLEDALATLCSRFDLDVALDVYKGKPLWVAGGRHIELPPGGFVLDFLDEDVTVTPDDFGGETKIALELFAEVVNNQKAPQRWRFGLHEERATLFARGIYKIIDLAIQDPPPSEEGDDDGAVKLSPISDDPNAVQDAVDNVAASLQAQANDKGSNKPDKAKVDPKPTQDTNKGKKGRQAPSKKKKPTPKNIKRKGKQPPAEG